MNTQTNTPKLRFPEFKSEWERKRLGEIAQITSGGTPNRSNPLFWNGKIPWVSTTLINFNTILETEEFITDEGLANSSAKIFPIGTILIALYGQGKTRGKVALLGINASTNQACAAIIPKLKEIYPLFLFYNLEDRYKKIRILSNLGGQENLSGDIIKSLPIVYPHLPEQKRIASFFTVLDKKIAELKQKKNLLEQYKKGVMQKLFSQELRFKDEKGKDFPMWEKKKLGEVTNIKSGLSKDQNITNTGYRVTRIETISDGKINLEKVGYIDESENIADYKIKKGDILFSNINSVAHIGKTAIAKSDIDLYHGMNLLCLRSIALINPLFLYYLLNTNKLRNYFKSICNQAVSQASINQSALAKTIIEIPCYPEQTKIANFLSAVDEKINHTQTQIEKTELYKKGLLQKMFC